MLKVVAKFCVKAEELNGFLEIMKVLVQETNKNDAGCISYVMYQDMSNPQIVTMIEEWESQEAADLHLKAKHFLDAISKIGPVYESTPEFNYYRKLF